MTSPSVATSPGVHGDLVRRIAAAVDPIAARIGGPEDVPAQLSSLYGLLIGAAYSLCVSVCRLEVKKAPFRRSRDYLRDVRSQLHLHLGAVAGGNVDAFATELVGLHINTAQHFLHILLDRLLNTLIDVSLSGEKAEAAMVYYQPIVMRVSLLRWRFDALDPQHRELRDELKRLDETYTQWVPKYGPGLCDRVVRCIMDNSVVNRPQRDLAALVVGAEIVMGSEVPPGRGSVAFVVDRTNEAKHLPKGAGRAELAHSQSDPAGVRLMYEVEWALTLLAFEHMASFAGASMAYLAGREAEEAGS